MDKISRQHTLCFHMSLTAQELFRAARFHLALLQAANPFPCAFEIRIDAKGGAKIIESHSKLA
jgi:hypothetical protein